MSQKLNKQFNTFPARCFQKILDTFPARRFQKILDPIWPLMQKTHPLTT
jgi:hypothetical protein